MIRSDEPVLVVGGRTTGIMMAAELARFGVPVRIIDKSPGIDPHSRATYLHSRTLEIFHGLSLADEIVAQGQPMKALSIYANGRHVVTTPDLPVDSPFPWGAAYAQNKTEVILERHLNGLGVEVQRSTELLSLEEADDAVHATLRHADGSDEVVRTPWLIGCDGAHSVTRREIDETFPGEMDPIPYMGADVVIDGPIKPEVAYLCLHDEGDVFFFLLDGGRRQVLATLPKHSQRQAPPTLTEMQEIVDQRGFTQLKLSDPRWLTTYRTHYRLVPKYRRHRVFLAGDAAHIHSVIGGQGMNTGIQDAHNLAWKLAMVMRGMAPEWWLDTYESERRGIAANVIEWTKRANEELTQFAELAAEERERLCDQMIVPECERMQVRQHQEELDLDYRASRLCVEPEAALMGGPSAGSRAPDATDLVRDDEKGTFIELTRRPVHHLLLFHVDASDAIDLAAVVRETVDRCRDWMEVLVVGLDPLPDGAVAIDDTR
ncbi:MAG: FAD-dependent monooxygenase, partial [Planctomycetota bacterium]